MSERATNTQSESRNLLRRHIAVLEARRDALSDLSRIGDELRSRLCRDPEADIDGLLDAREQQCNRLSSLASSIRRADSSDAGQVADDSTRDARAVASLKSESLSLVEDILACQRECEAVLRERLSAASDALQESVRRRKLDAAYGPAHKRSTPTFLDKQQ